MNWFNTFVDKSITRIMKSRYRLLSISIGLVFIIFGGLKFLPQLSPAESIAVDTVQALTFHQLSSSTALLLLAILEITIGILLLLQKGMKVAVSLAVFHLIMTFSPFLIFPDRVFRTEVNSLSLLGQYIIKNIVLLSALLILYPSNPTKTEQAYS